MFWPEGCDQSGRVRLQLPHSSSGTCNTRCGCAMMRAGAGHIAITPVVASGGPIGWWFVSGRFLSLLPAHCRLLVVSVVGAAACMQNDVYVKWCAWLHRNDGVGGNACVRHVNLVVCVPPCAASTVGCLCLSTLTLLCSYWFKTPCVSMGR